MATKGQILNLKNSRLKFEAWIGNVKRINQRFVFNGKRDSGFRLGRKTRDPCEYGCAFARGR
jgi:hypothetical protein